MSQRAGAHGRISGVRAWIARLAADTRGVAAIEFAFVVPLLLSMYFVTMEVSQGIEAHKKVSRIGSMVADLVTQQQVTTTGELNAIMKIGEALLQPYNRSRPTVTITAIQITDQTTPQPEVFWSRKLVAGTPGEGLNKGDPTTVPAALNVRGSFLVRVESTLNYQPVIAWAETEGAEDRRGLMPALFPITMTQTYYLRPRMSSQVTCSDC